MSKSNTQKLSDYLATLDYHDIPAEVVEQVKRLTIHLIGISLAAGPIDQTKSVINYVEKKGGTPEATIWGKAGKKVPVEEAVFANSTIADILDWEDCSWTGHPSAGVIPTAFALAQAHQLTGKDYITAVTAGYEGYQRIAMAVQPSKKYAAEKGWGLASWQIFSASIAAAKALGLDAKQFNQTIGATVYSAAVPTTQHSNTEYKSDIYHYAHGSASRNGVAAAKLAEIGFGNGYDYLDGEHGYWVNVSDQHDPSWYTKELGKRWLITETYIKHWPANMWIQTPLEILDSIYKENPFTADEVAKIRLSPITSLTAPDYAQSGKTMLDAQFNAPFCLAAYILNPTPSARWFAEDQLENAEVIALASKFEAFGEHTVPWDHFITFQGGSFPTMTIEVHLKDGTVLSKTAAFPKGHPQNNTTLAEEYEAFQAVTAPFLPKEAAQAIIKAIDNLENLQTLEEIAENIAQVKGEENARKESK